MDLTFGARLRSQRERQHVELAAIAEETKINAALLEGLERDDLSRWPGGLFRRAYVRTYAQKIGLDPEQVVREFLSLYPDPVDDASPVEAIAQSSNARRPRTRLGFLIAGLAGRRAHRTDATARRVTPGVPEPARPAVPVQPVIEEAPLAAPLDLEALSLSSEREESIPRPPARLIRVPPPDPDADPWRDGRFERHVGSVARLCTRIACARDDQDVSAALEETVRMLEAQGAILWVLDGDRDTLYPALAHGYPDELLAKLPDVDRLDDNAIAAAFCCGQKQVVRGAGSATGALVTPLMTPDGCAGALALEFTDGGEQHELSQSLATIITAQLSTLFAVTPHAALQQDWEQPDRSLVAS
jgi:hypothetical protein